MNNPYLKAVNVIAIIITVIAGIVFIWYGTLVGIVGRWVDGPVSTAHRILGIIILLYGILYCVPGSLIRNRKLLKLHFGLCIVGFSITFALLVYFSIAEFDLDELLSIATNILIYSIFTLCPAIVTGIKLYYKSDGMRTDSRQG